jgi:hypothetical protein
VAAQRSRVTNGAKTFLDGDAEHTAWARRFRDKVGIITADLGGADVLSEGQRSLIRATATLGVQLEVMEAALACGEDIDVDKYARAANSLRRICETLGLRRVARDMTPSLADLATTINAREAAEAE